MIVYKEENPAPSITQKTCPYITREFSRMKKAKEKKQEKQKHEDKKVFLLDPLFVVWIIKVFQMNGHSGWLNQFNQIRKRAFPSEKFWTNIRRL